MRRDNAKFYIGLACGSLHAQLYQLGLPMGLKISLGFLLIGLGLFVVSKVP